MTGASYMLRNVLLHPTHTFSSLVQAYALVVQGLLLNMT